ncbi:MAG TPA: RNA methyltransferase [Candidatus Sphingobacterium stercorigallinarum]|nr:RNA methyltransferase [Candidatus Sphingobacterium stercorigallinarum]
MLSKAQISLVTSLRHKKFRQQHRLFVVEGHKSVQEFMHSNYRVTTLFAVDEVAAKLGKIPQNIKLQILSWQEFNKISSLKSPQGSLALVELPEQGAFSPDQLTGQVTLMLDDIQDPGNLGTIIRTAEWFGIEQIICSLDTVDAYNPKVVQATMGSLARVKLGYIDLEEWIPQIHIPVYGAVLNGQSIYEIHFPSEAIILMGNEGNGICQSLVKLLQHKITIPKIGQAESLNVAIATTIFCSEVTRQRLTRTNG